MQGQWRGLILAVALGTTLVAQGEACGQDKIPVVASFSVIGDITGVVGGERVSIRTLVPPDGDAHTYQPTPNDSRAIAQARLVVVNGL